LRRRRRAPVRSHRLPQGQSAAMTGDPSVASAVSLFWPGLAVVLGLVALAAVPVVFWRRRREAEGESRTGQLQRDSAPPRADRDRPSTTLDLDALEVSDIMIHRTAMRALNAGDPAEENVKAVLESAYTRMPLWSGSVDNIVGVVHAKD